MLTETKKQNTIECIAGDAETTRSERTQETETVYRPRPVTSSWSSWSTQKVNQHCRKAMVVMSSTSKEPGWDEAVERDRRSGEEVITLTETVGQRRK